MRSSRRSAAPHGEARAYRLLLRRFPTGGRTLTGSSDRDSTVRLPAAPIDGATALQLGRSGDQDALDQLRRYSAEELAGALQELGPVQRVEFLESAERVEEIVPLLPETEFTSTVRGAGIEESGWLVEFASTEQRVAAVDLDCWRDFRFSPSRLFEWLDAMIAAGPETLAASFDELDPELWVLAMKHMGTFSISGFEDDAPGEGMTEDGIVFYEAHSAESEERIREILSTAMVYAPRHYWRLVYGAIADSEAEAEQFAARWHRNRLGDLGFPDRRRAMRAYRPLAVADALVPIEPAERDALVAASSQAPALRDAGLTARTLAELPPGRADEIMGDVLRVANTLAVADQLPLAERESVELSLAKALRGIDRGLSELARAQQRSPAAVLNTTFALDLFRVGATLEPDLRPATRLRELRAAEAGEDWSVETEMIAEEDRVVGRDGRLK